MTDEQLAIRLKKCIERLGHEFHRVSDSHFWYEYDTQFRLLCYLSDELEHDLVCKDAPRIVHAPFPARNGQRYDIVVFEPSVADAIVTEDFRYDDFSDRIKKRIIAATVEVAFAYHSDNRGLIISGYRGDIQKAIRRLVDNSRPAWSKRG